MPKLTDDQLGDLLRETFADHVDDLKSLPEATKRRRIAPALVAAAAVLTVLAGTVMNGSLNTAQRPAPAASAADVAAIASTGDDVQIWSTVAAMVIDQGPEPAPAAVALAAFDVKISELQRTQISNAVGPSSWVEWMWSKPRSSTPITAEKYAGCSELAKPIVFLGKVVDKGRYREVHAGMSRGCGYKNSALYRLEKQGNTWMVESVSKVTQTVPQGR